MKKLLLILCIFGFVYTQAQKPFFTSAKIEAATVYFNAAEISQSSIVNLPQGTHEIVIKNIANTLNENTIQIAAPSHLTVLSVQYTKNYISEYEIDETNPTIKKVRDSIHFVNKKIEFIQIEKTTISQTILLLDKNQQIYGANSGLNVSELIKMVEYYKKARTDLSKSFSTLNEEENKWKERLQKLNAQLQINTKNEEKTSDGKLVLNVMNEKAGKIEFGINYISNTASWNPFYDLRAESINSPIKMLYKAKVQQNSGIDWKKIKLSLSSGTPNQNNIAPLLQAWFLRFGNNYRGYNNSNAVLNSIAIKGNAAGLEIDDDKQNESSISKYTTINENQLNVSFDIDIPYDILSNGKAHSVALKELELPATYTYYSVPKAEKSAFLLAEISNYAKYNLLDGEANVIFEGLYVGKVGINTSQTTDTLQLSMGRDKRISILREKVADKSGTKFLSTFKEQIFTYDITVRNNKSEKIDLILKDQYPISTDNEIEIELLEAKGAKINKETGILTWDLKLSEKQTKTYRISYKVRYPKDKNIVNL